MTVCLKKENCVEECKIGYSWTTLFFGFITPIFRNDFRGCGLMLILTLIVPYVQLLVVPFIYNRLYIKGLLTKGYEPLSERDKIILREKRIYI